MQRFRSSSIWMFILAAPLLACSSNPQPRTAPAPQPTAAPISAVDAAVQEAPLQPSDAALRASRSVSLTGLELGTMWTFENPPLEYWSETYGFTPSQAWLDQVRLASVRVGTFCSGSFVSPDGLVMTNHHCARECVEAQSTGDTDYVEEGFYASSREDELVCPELYLDQLVGIEDVTTRVQSAPPANADAGAVARAIEAEIEELETQCASSSGNECQVVTLFHGGQYQLYRYRRFQPVKLVFAPELQAGFFGGDPDNFTYPRYALDVSFLRAYDGDERSPASTTYFPWRRDPVGEGELALVTGNPGSTSRMITVAELLYEQRYRHPFLVQLLAGQSALLHRVAERSPEAEQQVRQQIFSVENSLKAYRGQLAGLRDTLLVGRKIRWEREFRERINADAALRAQFGDVWDRIADIQARKFAVSPRLNLTNPEFVGVPQIAYARQLVDYVRGSARSDAEQSEEFRANRAQIEAMLRTPSQVDPELATELLVLYLALADTWLEPGDPLRATLFQPGEDAAVGARRLAAATRILEAAYRQELIAGGTAALTASTDPFIRLALQTGPANESLAAEWAGLTADERVQEERLARALFATYGTDLPPDATFTLRISDGVVQRYPYNGTFAPPFTTFYGLYARSAEFSNEMPWTLPDAFGEHRDDVDMDTPINFVSTNDITGGNSGSPLIDREARVIGLAFDNNVEGLPNEFLFRPDSGGRTVSVHAAGILEALRNAYQATALVDELLAHAQ